MKPTSLATIVERFSTALQNLGVGEWALLVTLISLVCDLFLSTLYAFRMFGKLDLHEIFIGKKLVVCNFMMIEKLVVGRFFILKKLVGFMPGRGSPP